MRGDVKRWKTGARRLALAFAISIVLHGIIAAFVRPSRLSAPPQREIVVVTHLITIQHRPPPTLKPTPLPVHPRHITVIAPAHLAVATPGKAAPHHHITRKAQAAPRVKTRHHAQRTPVPVVMGGQGAGAGTGKAPVGGNGPGGAGTGQGDAGTGSGAAASAEPCGFIEFTDIGGLSRYDQSTGGYWVDIRMTVHFPDDRSAEVVLDYPWYYPSQAVNPWSDQNVENPDFPVTFQWPPAARAPYEPPLVQYVMQHTTAGGYTKLKDCPGAPTGSPSPA